MLAWRSHVKDLARQPRVVTIHIIKQITTMRPEDVHGYSEVGVKDWNPFLCSSVLPAKHSPPRFEPRKRPASGRFCRLGLGFQRRNDTGVLSLRADLSPKLGGWADLLYKLFTQRFQCKSIYKPPGGWHSFRSLGIAWNAQNLFEMASTTPLLTHAACPRSNQPSRPAPHRFVGNPVPVDRAAVRCRLARAG